MGVKQIVFKGQPASSSGVPFPALDVGWSSSFTAFDYVMIGILVVLIGLSIYYIVTAPKTTEQFAMRKRIGSDRSNKKLPHNRPQSRQTFVNAPPKKRHDDEHFSSSKTKYKVVYIYMTGCPYCVKFDKTHADVSSDDVYAKTFAFEKIEVGQASDYTTKFKCNGFPCYIVLDNASGDLVTQGTGYRSTDDFKSWLSNI
jgi:thioredoxin-related protein